MSEAMCTDCGCTPRNYWNGDLSYCRRCACKGGHEYNFRREIDVEKLEALLGRELTEKIITECGWSW